MKLQRGAHFICALYLCVLPLSDKADRPAFNLIKSNIPNRSIPAFCLQLHHAGIWAVLLQERVRRTLFSHPDPDSTTILSAPATVRIRRAITGAVLFQITRDSAAYIFVSYSTYGKSVSSSNRTILKNECFSYVLPPFERKARCKSRQLFPISRVRVSIQSGQKYSL